MSIRHKDQQPADGIHTMHAFEFANAADRLAFANELNGFTGPALADVGKVVRQTDNDTFFVISDDSPLIYLPVGGTHQFLWGDNSLGSSTTTRYLTPGYDDGTAETSPTQIEIIRTGTLRNLRVRHNDPAGNGNPIVYTVRVNNKASFLAVSLASTATSGSDLVNTVPVVAGDVVDIEVTKAAIVGASPSNITLTLEYAP